jgi:hypothetical protein
VRPSRRKRRTFILYTFALRYVAHLCRSPKQIFPSCNVPVHGGWVTGRLIGLVVVPWFALRCVGSGSGLWVERRIEMPLEGGEIGKAG